MVSPLIDHWVKIERLLARACESMGEALSDAGRSKVCEYLDHNELGLAYETLLWEIEPRGQVNRDNEVAACLLEAASLMGVDPPKFLA